MHFITYTIKYRVEILLSCCCVLSGVLLWVVVRGQSELGQTKLDKSNGSFASVHQERPQIFNKKPFISVEISGAVYKPGVYELEDGARVVALLKKSGGLNKQSDKEFFYRNYNQARLLQDGEKIHAPSKAEVASGAFIETPLLIYVNELTTEVKGSEKEMGGALGGGAGSAQNPIQNLIHINTSTQAELESLPGVGAVTAAKIIQNRPYAAVDDLQTKAIMSVSLFDKIKNAIAL